MERQRHTSKNEVQVFLHYNSIHIMIITQRELVLTYHTTQYIILYQAPRKFFTCWYFILIKNIICYEEQSKYYDQHLQIAITKVNCCHISWQFLRLLFTSTQHKNENSCRLIEDIQEDQWNNITKSCVYLHLQDVSPRGFSREH